MNHNNKSDLDTRINTYGCLAEMSQMTLGNILIKEENKKKK